MRGVYTEIEMGRLLMGGKAREGGEETAGGGTVGKGSRGEEAA